MSSCYSSGAVQSVLLASACKSFEAGVDGWLSADSGVRVSHTSRVRTEVVWTNDDLKISDAPNSKGSRA